MLKSMLNFVRTPEQANHATSDSYARTDWFGFLLMTGCILPMYLLTQCDALSPAHDSVLYLRMIEAGEYFHPHHLLYNGAAALWLEFWRMMFPSADAVMLISWMNGMFGALSVGVVFLLLRGRAMLSRRQAMIGAVLPAASFGVWFYSVTIEVYIPALLFLLTAFYLLTDERRTVRSVIAAGAVHGCAMLFHQVHILFTIPALFVLLHAIIAATDRQTRLHAMRAAAGYAAAAVLVTCVPYIGIGVAILGHSTPQGFMSWLLSYALEEKYWQPLGLTTVVQVSIGFVHSIIGGDFLVRIDAMFELIQRAVPTKWIADQRFAVRNMPSWLAWTIAFAFVIFAGILMTQFWLLLRRGLRRSSKLPNVLKVTTLFFLTYALYFSFWEPSNLEFWIPQSVLFWFAFLLLLYRTDSDGMRRNRSVVVLVLAGLLLVINGAGSILWLMPKENDYYALQAEAMANVADEAGVVVLYDAYMLEMFLGSAYKQRLVIVADSLRKYDNDPDRGFEAVTKRLLREREAGVPIVIHGECVQPFVLGKPHPTAAQQRMSEQMRKRFSNSWHPHHFPAGVVYHVSASRE